VGLSRCQEFSRYLAGRKRLAEISRGSVQLLKAGDCHVYCFRQSRMLHYFRVSGEDVLPEERKELEFFGEEEAPERGEEFNRERRQPRGYIVPEKGAIPREKKEGEEGLALAMKPKQSL
jgi:hypothetical protein